MRIKSVHRKLPVFILLMLCMAWMAAAFRSGERVKDGAYPLDYPAYFGNRIYIAADNPTTKTGVQLGRMLFYEKALSADGSISCGSCHKQELAFTDGRKLSAGIDGTPTKRNAMALVNLLWVNEFFWDGRAKGLEEQAKVPLTDPHEMGQPLDVSVRKLMEMEMYPPLFRAAFGSDSINGERITKALAQFERTLISANSPYDRYLDGNYSPSESAARGMALFFGNPQPDRQLRGAACGHCHSGPKTFSQVYHNTGLDSVLRDAGRADFTNRGADSGRFRVATLRNIALTAPYMHDGRFQTLDEVLDHYSDHIVDLPELSPFLQGRSNEQGAVGLKLTSREKEDIVAFLHLLTDSTFIQDSRFSNPFPKGHRNYIN